MAAEYENWECNTADQKVKVADTLLQIVVGSTLQLVGMVGPIGTVELADIVGVAGNVPVDGIVQMELIGTVLLLGTVKLADIVQMEQVGNVELVGFVQVAGIVLLIAEESYIWFLPSLFFRPCKSTLQDFCM